MQNRAAVVISELSNTMLDCDQCKKESSPNRHRMPSVGRRSDAYLTRHVYIYISGNLAPPNPSSGKPPRSRIRPQITVCRAIIPHSCHTGNVNCQPGAEHDRTLSIVAALIGC
jgi:hypothetical protein